MTPEGKVKAQVDKLLKRYNVWFYKPVSNGMGKHGIPDYVCCTRGRFLGIECKAGQGVLTALQRVQREAIVQAGGVYFVATPDTLVDLDRLLQGLTHATGP